MTSSSNQRQQRYLRQEQFAPLGERGQKALASSRVAILGCGALGTVAAELLARSGVGSLHLIDRDLVEWSNLQRQALFTEQDAEAGAAKAEAAARRLRQINSEIQIVETVVDVTAVNIQQTLGKADLVVDACDNFALRLLLNDWSLETKTAWVHGGAVGATGQVRLFLGKPPCFRCLVPDLPDPGSVATCDTAGVLAPTTHFIASLQVLEAIKFLSGCHEVVSGSVQSFDLWRNRACAVAIDQGLMSQCRACAHGHRDFLNAVDTAYSRTVTLCGRDAVQIAPDGRSVDFDRIMQRWRPSGSAQQTRFFVRLQLDESQSVTLFRDGRAVITGVRDVAHGRVLFDRFVGS
ncbi:MAG: ThiF family adenylyltransferase [Planctomycetota bacterium]